jgi:aminoglycoside phosphotransferase (APT) family kinase protein
VTRLEIDTAVPRGLIEPQFARWAELPIEPVEHDGWDNRTFRLGADLSIRVPTGEWHAKQFAKEQRWLPALAAAATPDPGAVAQGEPDDGFRIPGPSTRWRDDRFASSAAETPEPGRVAATAVVGSP